MLRLIVNNSRIKNIVRKIRVIYLPHRLILRQSQDSDWETIKKRYFDKREALWPTLFKLRVIFRFVDNAIKKRRNETETRRKDGSSPPLNRRYLIGEAASPNGREYRDFRYRRARGIIYTRLVSAPPAFPSSLRYGRRSEMEKLEERCWRNVEERGVAEYHRVMKFATSGV